MELKKYQKSALETLEYYLNRFKTDGPNVAFYVATGRVYQADHFGDVPFVCMKVPTGGGKTLMGCYAIASIMQIALQNKMDRGILMWFVPSEAIKTQTLKLFKDRTDATRKALDDAFQNGVRVFSIEESLAIRREDVSDNLCIIIGTLDAFRKEKALQKKYKVYQENGALLNHFERLEGEEGLEKDEEGTVINSLANVIRINSPVIFVDEGHKAKTGLSIEFLKELNPSFVFEFTATPVAQSNILIDISPSDLKNEEMIKIPIVLESASQWQNAVVRGIEKRDELEKEAKKNKKEYIRPVALIQAQPKSKTQSNVTVQQIKEYLLAAKISDEEIAIKTSERNDLEGIDLLSKKCKIRYIITVSALAEGWDCSFAYVLISVANVGAKIAVEQIIGRIIRMPYAKRKASEALNRSYIFASAKNFNEAASAIVSGLERNGYSKLDLLAASKKGDVVEDSKIISRSIKEDFAPPLVSFEKDRLTFEGLIGDNFQLARQDAKFDFDIHYDNDGRAIIDFENDKWSKGVQQWLNLTYKDKNFSKNELVRWLDKKLRFTLLEQSDKVKFIEKAIDYQLKGKTLVELSVNRYLLNDRLNEVIRLVLTEYAKKQFDKNLSKSISVKTFDKFSDSIILKQAVPQDFKKNYYEKIDKLNKEELSFVERLDLDTLPNIKFWIRNREKQDPFYIQGWKTGKFYPDFIAVTKRGNIIALEWKGEDRVSNEDTEYKVEIGKIWENLGEGNLHFFLVHNKNIEEVLGEIKGID